MEDKLTGYLDLAIDNAVYYLPRIALAIVLLLMGFRVINRAANLMKKSLEKTNFSPEIISFIGSFAGIGLKIILLLIVAGLVGIDTTALVGVLAAAGFAVGLALQGSLSNFAAGIIILVFRPYKVGDWIEVQEKFGKVEEIQIFNTIIGTPGSKTLIIPNGQIIEGIVTNFSTKGAIRVELNVTMPYAESFPRVKAIIQKVLKEVPNVISEPVPEIGIESFDSHNIILTVRPYVHPEHYWQVTFDAHQKIKEAFFNNNIRVAYSEGIELGEIGE